MNQERIKKDWMGLLKSKKPCMLVLCLLFCSITAFAAEASEKIALDKGSKTLIVYFSRADENYGVGTVEKGNTQILAEMIAKETGGTLFKIEPVKAYPKDYDDCTDIAKKEQKEKARPAYKGDVKDFSKYDVVYLGFPNWWGDMPMIVYRFLESHDFSGKTIHPFCTHEGSGLSSTERNIQKVCPKAIVEDGLEMHGSIAQKDRSKALEKVKKWLESR